MSPELSKALNEHVAAMQELVACKNSFVFCLLCLFFFGMISAFLGGIPKAKAWFWVAVTCTLVTVYFGFAAYAPVDSKKEIILEKRQLAVKLLNADIQTDLAQFTTEERTKIDVITAKKTLLFTLEQMR